MNLHLINQEIFVNYEFYLQNYRCAFLMLAAIIVAIFAAYTGYWFLGLVAAIFGKADVPAFLGELRLANMRVRKYRWR